jgi:hypothetical protein
MLVETVKVMLNCVYLQQGLDFRLAHKDGSVEGGAQAPQAADGLVVFASPGPRTDQARLPSAADDDIPAYEARAATPQGQHSRSSSGRPEARREVVRAGSKIPVL